MELNVEHGNQLDVTMINLCWEFIMDLGLGM
jgi:hypothetical protein